MTALQRSHFYNAPNAPLEPPMDTRTSPHYLRLTRLRAQMQHAGVDAFLVPSRDPHLSK